MTVRRLGLASLVVLASACTGLSRVEQLRLPRRATDGYCTWLAARWEDNGELLVPRTGAVLGRARTVWDGERWAGARVNVVLRDVGPVHLLEGRWTGEGLSLDAEVDVGEQAALRLAAPRRLGRAGLVLAGAPLQVSVAAEGHVVAAPAREAWSAFRPADPPVLDLECDALALQGAPPKTAAEALQLSGFKADAEPRQLAAGQDVDAVASPGGPVIGRFVSAERPVRGFVVERRAPLARFVVPTAQGVVWVAWVPEQVLEPASEVAAPAVELHPRARAGSGPWRRCSDELTLSLRTNDEPLPLGAVAPGTRFSLGPVHDDHTEASLDVGWLDLSPERALLLPRSVSRCPTEFAAPDTSFD